ncbi:hypothetical protein AC579_6230 [Pseudocercospora musae]|uniref:Uncharacterized protein n=1 Tax=Pseudocercospora musae TaxID=113226 RepID=A0A139HBW9_9PEZI|nr:hypothetical protein AC579_6230 [Pseudocercospora musae]
MRRRRETLLENSVSLQHSSVGSWSRPGFFAANGRAARREYRPRLRPPSTRLYVAHSHGRRHLYRPLLALQNGFVTRLGFAKNKSILLPWVAAGEIYPHSRASPSSSFFPPSLARALLPLRWLASPSQISSTQPSSKVVFFSTCALGP